MTFDKHVYHEQPHKKKSLQKACLQIQSDHFTILSSSAKVSFKEELNIFLLIQWLPNLSSRKMQKLHNSLLSQFDHCSQISIARPSNDIETKRESSKHQPSRCRLPRTTVTRELLGRVPSMRVQPRKSFPFIFSRATRGRVQY